jgi:8-oxo-dGTP pyrophosphatase MutT (NUDIX family)
MFLEVTEKVEYIQRVRAILLTEDNRLMLIKRVKPNNIEPYWVAPGGGVEDEDIDLFDTLERELSEELGARALVLELAFVLHHEKAEKNLEEHFFICRLLDYDLSQRHGPEFSDPSKGKYIPDEIDLTKEAIEALNIKTVELRDWLLDNLAMLHDL